ncbi:MULTISPECIES: ImmA/IrrE family metallo-endopeptidase [Peribacillus]|uniref:ImmA/IrrE family metallo-endopeptidase n=1 Tax=Peribacillus TaxID=2675229 RepID=UPI00286972AD|nr:ImmA/IrrE family metallo-endopeptidase [Peribacillus sp. R9-11]WMX57414.1 ImmA/IrrE family metallo-endopeptidase [Peribacillus sp. R9-11]
MHYNKLLFEYEEIPVREKELEYGFKGLYRNGHIIIERRQTKVEKGCILAEELGHHFKTVGNIIDQTNLNNVKQEKIARRWAYNEILPLSCFVAAYEYGCTNRYEVADFLNVTEEFLQEALDRYIEIYGDSIYHHDLTIRLNPLDIIGKERKYG